MKKILPYLIAFTLSAFQTIAQKGLEKPELSKKEVADADSMIVALVEKKQKPSQEKVEYFSRLTRYGFKNLF